MSISFISYPDQPARTLGRHLLRVAGILVFLAIWILIYIELNARGAHSERAVTFRSPIDRYPWIYQPWTAVIYVFAGVSQYDPPVPLELDGTLDQVRPDRVRNR